MVNYEEVKKLGVTCGRTRSSLGGERWDHEDDEAGRGRRRMTTIVKMTCDRAACTVNMVIYDNGELWFGAPLL